MTPPKAANDNPRPADSFGDLAERRAWVAQRRHKTRQVLAWPTFERLSRLESPDAAEALFRYAELVAPPHMAHANDNDPEALDGDPDLVQEIKPSEKALLRAATADLVVSFASREDANSGWRIAVMDDLPVAFVGTTVHLGDLVFRAGQLVSCGRTKRGNPKRPYVITRGSKGAKTLVERSETSIRRLLPANDNTPIAGGSGWLGGITRAKGLVTRPNSSDHAAAEFMDRMARQRAIRLALGSETTLVLDVAITDATAKEIGELFGYAGKTAERRGIGKINEAIRKFGDIA